MTLVPPLSLPSPTNKILLSLAMIVRDGGQDLATLLEDASHWVEEIVIGDTGSQDGSEALAAHLGARVHHITWQNDFAAARNTVLNHCHGNWILILDADEQINAGDWRTIRNWITGHQRSGTLAAASFGTRNYLPTDPRRHDWTPVPTDDAHSLPEGPAAPGFVATRKVRLFPNQPTIRFRGHLHESVADSLRDAQINVSALPVQVHRFGYLSSNREKQGHDLHLAHLKAAQQPHSARVWADLANCAVAVGDLQQALVAIERSLALDPLVAQNQLTAGWLLINADELQKAEIYLKALAERRDLSHHLRAEMSHLRAQIAIREERPQQAAELLAVALHLVPNNGHYHNTLASLELLQGRKTAAGEALARACVLLPDNVGPCLNLGMLCEATADIEAAAEHYTEALRRDPANEAAAAALIRTELICV